jgi:hypothetical protein
MTIKINDIIICSIIARQNSMAHNDTQLIQNINSSTVNRTTLRFIKKLYILLNSKKPSISYCRCLYIALQIVY